MADCFYHPANPARAKCVQCGLPLCGDCLYDAGGGQLACKQCLPVVQARLAREAANPHAQRRRSPPARAGQPPPQVMTPGSYRPPTAQTGKRERERWVSEVEQYVAWLPRITERSRPSIGTVSGYFTGLLLAILIAAVGTVVWEKIAAAKPLEIAGIMCIVGYLTAWPMLRFYGEGGVTAITVGIVFATAVALGHVLWFNDMSARLPGVDLSHFLKGRTIYHWVWIGAAAIVTLRGPLHVEPKPQPVE